MTTRPPLAAELDALHRAVRQVRWLLLAFLVLVLLLVTLWPCA
jgi:hypothetical protein